MPFKIFAVNEILTAADVNDYFAEQVISTFAGTAERGSAIGTPVAGQFAFLTDTNTLTFYNGTAAAWQNYGDFDFAPKLLVETTEQTANYTLTLDDVNKIVNMNVSGGGTVTIPDNATTAFELGSVVGVYNQDSSDVVLTAGTAVTIRGGTTVAQFSEVSLRKRDSDEWVVAGA